MRLPAPVFFVLYNGTTDFPEEKLYRLSDSFLEKPPGNSMELVVKVINISYTKGAKILQKNRTLWEYSRFVHLVQTYLRETGSLEEAVRLGILDAEKEGILTEFLKKHGTEVLGMLYKEVTQERYGEIREEEGFERGCKQAAERINELNRRLLRCGRTEDVMKAASDEEYQEQLFKEYGI